MTLNPGVVDSFQVFGRAEPQVDSPFFDFKIPAEGISTTGLVHIPNRVHASQAQLKIVGQPLSQPQRVGTATATGNEPCGVIRVRTCESIIKQPSIHRRATTDVTKGGTL